MPNYLLGLPDSFSQGSTQVENVRNYDLRTAAAGQLEDPGRT